MCGVFGFITNDKDRLNLDTLQKVARATQARGPHAFGFAWIDQHGRIKSYRAGGKISDHLGLLAMAKDARLLIGHCRYATHGSPADNINNHPHPCDGGWIVHNGTIRNYESLIHRFGLEPVSRCDSELLGLMIEQETGTFMDRCVAAVQSVNSQPLVMLGLWARPERLIAVRDGNPLFMGHAKEGRYLGSCRGGLPGRLREVKDGEVLEFTVADENFGTTTYEEQTKSV